MSGGRQTKVRRQGVLNNVLTFLWASQLCGFEGQRGVFMCNQVSTHYELSFISLCCHWPVNGTSRLELSRNKGEEWKKLKWHLSVRPTQREHRSVSLQRNKMNHEKWDIVRFLKLEEWLYYVWVFFLFLFDAIFVCCIHSATPLQSHHTIGTNENRADEAGDTDWTRVTDKWPHPRADACKMADGVMQRPDREGSWVKWALFFHEGGGQFW